MSATVIERPTDAAVSDQSVRELLERSVLFSISFRVFGNTRKVDSSLVEVDADKDSIGVNKRLLDSKELAEINRKDAQFQQWLRRQSLPSPFGNGIYIMPLVSVEAIEQRCTAYQAERKGLVDAFLDVLADQVRDARGRLRSAFSERDYPPAEVVESRFQMAWSYLSLTAPGNLPPTLVAREREKIAAQWQEALAEGRQVLRAGMADLVDWLLDKAQGISDGQKKIIKPTKLAGVQEFLDSFAARNLTGDEELAALVEQAKGLLRGIDPETLRKSQDTRTQVSEGFAEIKRQLTPLLTDRPVRLINLDDEAA